MRAPLAAAPEERSLRTNLITITGSTLARVILGFAASVVVTRTLGPEGRGQFSFVLTTLAILVMLAGAGGFTAVTATSVRHGRSVAQLYPATAATAAGIAVVVGGGFSVAYLVLRDSLFGGVSGLAVLAVAVTLIPTLVMGYWSVVAALDDRLVSFSVGSVVGSALYLVAVTAAAATGTLSTGTALLLWVVGSLTPLVTVARWKRLVPRPGQRTVTGELLRHAMRANFGDIALLLVMRIDVLAVKGYRGFTEVGVYAVATALAELFLQGGVSLRVVFLRKQGRPTERAALAALLARSTRLLFVGGLVGAVVMAFLARPAITLVFGPTFAGAGRAAAILAPGVLAVALQGPLRDYILVESRAVLLNVMAGLTLVLNVAANVVLLPTHTYLVAAVISTLTYIVNFLVCALYFCRLTDTTLKQLLVPGRDDVAAVRALLRRRTTDALAATP